MFFESVPGRKIFLNVSIFYSSFLLKKMYQITFCLNLQFNDNVIFELLKEIRPNAILGNMKFHFRKAGVKMIAEFRASKDPLEVFASVQTARAGMILNKGEMLLKKKLPKIRTGLSYLYTTKTRYGIFISDFFKLII